MKRLSFLFFIFSFSFLAYAEETQVQKLEKIPSPSFTEPKITEHRFPNGLKLYFLENHELPVFEINALFRFGTVDDPADKKGLAKLMMSAWATGGSESHTGEEIDRSLEEVAAHLESKVKGEYATFGLKCLSADIDQMLPLFFDLMSTPVFDPKKIEIARHQMLDEISGRNEKPIEIANREFLQQLYGEESVWARLSSEKTVSFITRDDLLRFYRNFVAPNNTALIVSGNIDFSKLVSLIGNLTSVWSKREITFPHISPIEKKWNPGIYFISKPASQSGIVAGHFGDKRFNPDKFAVTLANQILGGLTFGSLLGDRIRTNLGLAYSIDSRFDFNTDYGPFRIFVNTKSASTAEVIREIKSLTQKLVQGEVTEEQLTAAKNTILNELVFQYEDPFDFVNTEAIYDFYGYPKHYLKIFQKEIRKVGLDNLKRVAKKYFFPDKMIFMVVGDPVIKELLSEIGKVTELPLDND